MSKRIGIWIRVSTEDQAQGDSPKHHEHRARSYVEMKGWQVIEVYHLEAVSGKAVLNHPEAKRMLEDVRKGHITGLIFSKLARLARNTRELLEFADIFQDCNADLISMDESIDTSSPAGRFFYTLIAGMAEWERAEIGSRVKASVSTRAKLGKSLGGEAPFGYKWENKELEIDPSEAPVRKLIHDLFLEHKRKRTVARILNDRGYKTRRGAKFSDTSIDRMLRDPIVKGMRRINYTESTGNKKKWKLKPKEEWVFIESPRIIPDETWDGCMRILDEMDQKKGKVRRKGVHLFSGIVQCECGTKMYMRTLSPKYVCFNCKNKISPDDLEEIFQSQLKNFVFSDTEIQSHLNKESRLLVEKQNLHDIRKKEFQTVKQKLSDILELYHEGELSKEAFREYHTPMYENQTKIEQSMMELQGEMDALKMQSLDNRQVLHEAQNLHSHWKRFNHKEKRSIIETITSSIIVGKEDIEINLSYLPTLVKEKAAPSSKSISCKNESYSSSKTVQLSIERMPLRVLQPPGERLRVCTGRSEALPHQDQWSIVGPDRSPCRGHTGFL